MSFCPIYGDNMPTLVFLDLSLLETLSFGFWIMVDEILAFFGVFLAISISPYPILLIYLLQV